MNYTDQILAESLPTRGAWIEINGNADEVDGEKSLPTRGAWIEIVAISVAV